MTTYNVHIYRELRLTYGGIEAESHEEAAAIARDKLTEDADAIDDCEGETFSAVVDVQGDQGYERTRLILFEADLRHKAAQRMLAALEGALYVLDENRDGFGPSKETAIADIRAAIAAANEPANDDPGHTEHDGGAS